MKKILLPLICVLFAFASCKKKAEVIPANTITATIDGTNYTFNTNLKATKVFVPIGPGSTTLNIQAYTGPDNTASLIGISLTSGDANAIAKGTYTLTSANLNPTVYPSVIFNGPDNNPGQQPFYWDETGVEPITITITSISNTNVQGTFNGKLLHTNHDGTSRTITNGKFNVTMSY